IYCTHSLVSSVWQVYPGSTGEDYNQDGTGYPGSKANISNVINITLILMCYLSLHLQSLKITNDLLCSFFLPF
uniref:Uncharacterized protein n=1 Tax=Sinocyclocheilus rhinocerous TaxID=307959 RepID=A0A673GAH4_9TELE